MIEKIAEKARTNSYFLELYNKLDDMVLHEFANIKYSEDMILNSKELNDLLRFADIFASTLNSDLRNLANKIVSNLSIFYKDNNVYKSYAFSIFTKMGLFPSLLLLDENVNNISIPDDIRILEAIKKTMQEDKQLNIIYTDKQYEVVCDLNRKNNYSLSAPTSFGKTMIISNFINKIITDKKCCNICILVPTNALLKEIYLDMKMKYETQNKSIKVISYPEIKDKDKHFDNLILVFTPERLLDYYANDNPEIEYLFIDEAQKTVKNSDERTPLYYNVISYASFKGSKLYFLSPNISNPEIFLSLVNRDENNVKRVGDKLVSQNRFIFDFNNSKIKYLGSDNMIREVSTPELVSMKLCEAIKLVYKHNLKETSTLVYFSSKSKMIDAMLEYIENEEYTKNEEILKLIDVVKSTVHDKYYLIKALERGIAFHYGQMPKVIREKIEDLFRNKTIKLLFTTSTLLEGVNIQAKNIILTSDNNGLSDLSEEDFLNLIGRAGRFRSELFGNVVCIVLGNSSKMRYKYFSSQNVSELKSDVISSTTGNFYKDIGCFIENKRPVTKNPDEHKKIMYIREQYANIAIFHNKISYNSKLNTNLIKVTKNTSIFNNINKNSNTADKLPKYNEFISIPIKYQNKILNTTYGDTIFKNFDPMYITYDQFLILIKLLFESYKLYNRGLVEYENSYKYYANLVYEWIKGRPLNVIIQKTLSKLANNKIDFYLDFYFIDGKKYYNAYDGSEKHINLVINDILDKIETDVKHMLKMHISNFIYLNVQNGNFDDRMLRLIDFIEFGTMNYKIIELQKFGFSRELSQFIIDYFSDEIIFENGELISINFHNIYKNFDQTNPLMHELEDYSYLLGKKQQN